jgi:para-aminobenzoate synthetase / 4-amino-4-deoxychorismate lyase
MSCFALLDDCYATEADPRSRLYSGYLHEHRCLNPTDLDHCWSQAQADLQQGRYALVLIDYEWGTQYLPRRDFDVHSPSLRFLIFDGCEKKSKPQIDVWLDQRSLHSSPVNIITPLIEWMKPSVDTAAYQRAIGHIQEWIRQGQTYQINYTYQWQGWAEGSPLELYKRLRQTQPVPFGALISLDDSTNPGTENHPWILSFSPELFVRHHQGQLTTRPMKGTAPRHSDSAQDAQNADWLLNNEKNRAENLMIVDLLRNDLGQIAQMGSVQVSELFSIEHYPTLHQMTSTITAQLQNGLDVPDVIQALFPCGSITGAPKHHTLSLIHQLETTPRGLYTGTIGWIDPVVAADSCPSFCFSVAIRTLMLGSENDQGQRPVELGIGSGIVADSIAEDEHQETLLKAQFLTSAFQDKQNLRKTFPT